jgi:hypothetical protein
MGANQHGNEVLDENPSILKRRVIFRQGTRQ